MMKSVLIRMVLAALLGVTSATAFGEPVRPPVQGGRDLTGALTLQQVVAQVLLHNPELQAYSFEIRAREARALQERLFPNPRIMLDTQDVLGSSGFKGFQQSQTTVTLSQVIELGGKRVRRDRAAMLNRDLASWDYEVARMNVLTQTAKAYADALAAQEKLKLARELVALSQKSFNAVKARVTAGKVSPIQEIKARVAVSSTQMALRQAENNLKAAYRRLAALWGSPKVSFDSVQGRLYHIALLPEFETLTARLRDNPDIARWSVELLQREAAVDLEKANAVPNLRVGAGARWFEETRDNTFIFELSIPLQFFDRNQGAIAEARHRLAKARARQRAVEIQLNTALSDSYTRLVNAHERVTSLKTDILPAARRAFEAVNEGYRFGKFGYLEMLDSQRTWFNARAQFLDALAEYHKAVADVERLTGAAMSPSGSISPPATGGTAP
ncbi:MAG: TolC family protein [Nitrospinaceae bacterium]|nr:TolC family protein [Nitrospinaceae bacterium]NIR56214.1 TolC family protein [Nitrospinaceae bacterium]NIS86670.1 TolC family protein [Nitrospinaceae bacterium]NIT83503.1 TolC family protein [Nitrospinaceae bacterium]NIU45708.1 TolC family protein [Nitrospinaceae bacterium]